MWERDLDLPIHRLDGQPKARVFAYTAELDAWRAAKGRLPDNGEAVANDGKPPNQHTTPDAITIRRSLRTWLLLALVALRHRNDLLFGAVRARKYHSTEAASQNPPGLAGGSALLFRARADFELDGRGPVARQAV